MSKDDLKTGLLKIYSNEKICLFCLVNLVLSQNWWREEAGLAYGTGFENMTCLWVME